MSTEEQRKEWADKAARMLSRHYGYSASARATAFDLANAVETLLREVAELEQRLDQREVGKYWASHDLALANRRIEIRDAHCMEANAILHRVVKECRRVDLEHRDLDDANR